MSDLDERVDNVSDGGDDDLFGDDGGDDASQIEDNPPIPSDDDVASDHNRRRGSDSASQQDDRSQRGASDEPEVQEQQKQVVEELMQRHGLPKTKDGNMQLAKVPHFLRFLPEAHDADSYQSSTWEIENSKQRIPVNLVRYRRNPETGELESNANIYRWSDGSLTIQVGEEHYDIQVKTQIPPTNKAYQPDRDANRYLAAAHSAQAQLLTVAHITEEWAIRPDKQRVDEDTELLRERMGLAKGGVREGDMIITANQDPELQKKQAEMAEKERARAQRKRENAQMRTEGGAGGYRKVGLSIGDLEGGRRSTSGRKRGQGGSSKRSRQRNEDYDSDDETMHQANDYDMGDGFIVASDEESVDEGNGEDDDLLDDGDVEYERPRTKRQRTEEASHDEIDADADGEPDDDAPTASGDHGRRRVRRVVSDDDDE